MQIISGAARRRAQLAAVVIVLAASAGCGIEKQSAPPLAGPSEFGLSVSLTATPDTIVQDGVSQSVIQIVVRDPNNRPVPNVGLQLSGTSSSPLIRQVLFTQPFVMTDSAGQATTGMIAPPAPATVPSTPPVITVNALPTGTNFANAVARPVEVRLMAPDGTPLENLNPNAVIVADPRVANFNETIRFDASLTTDEGQPCASRCQYTWEFGDDTVAVRAITAEHAFRFPGTYEVTLTVTDDRGGVDTATVDIRIIGPAAPTANFTVAPGSPTAGVAATFNASSSTVGVGATIDRYAWDFGDGSATVDSSSATVSKTYAVAGVYPVTLTVTDSLGRQATRSANVTVQ